MPRRLLVLLFALLCAPSAEARLVAIDAIDTASGAIAGAIRTGAAPARALATSPGGTRLAALAGTRLLVATLPQGRVVSRRHLPHASAIAFSPRGTLWALAPGRLLAANRGGAIHLGRGYTGGLAISPDGRRAYAGAGRGHAR